MKLKLLILLCMVFIGANSVFCEDLSDYRYNPFQFVYPEYNYKADITKIKKKTGPFNNLAKVSFFGLSAYIPTEYKITKSNETPDKITVKSGKKVIIINREKELRSGCIDEQVSLENRDFCSSFSSTKDLFYKLFTLSADDIENSKTDAPSTGVLWIIHRKGMLFENTQDIHVYEGDNYTAFVDVQKNIKGRALAKGITVFHEKISPDHYIDISTNIADDKILNNFLETLQ